MNPHSHHRSRRFATRGAALLTMVAAIAVIGVVGAMTSGTKHTGAPPITTILPAPTSSTVAPPPDSTAATDTAATTSGTATTINTATTAFAPLAAGAAAIHAKAYVVYDASAKKWLAESQGDERLPVGSTMKMLTAAVVLQAGNLTKVVTVPALHLAPSESAVGLAAGEQVTRNDLLRAMLVVSAGDAAETLAIDIGGTADAFVQQMNSNAQRLGMTNTVAGNPVGLDQTVARSTARDLVTLAVTLMQNATFRQIVNQTSVQLHGKTYQSTDKLLAIYPGATGVKTGHTTHAGYCVVSSVTRNGRTIFVAVLGAPTDAARFADARALLDWAFTH